MAHQRLLFKVSVLLFTLFIQQTDSIAVMSVDLGSEFIKIAIVKPGVPMEVALNKESRRKSPFVVSLKDKERLFGDPALAISVKQPTKAYIYLMRLLGKKFESPAVETFRKRFPYHKIYKDEIRGTVLFQGEDNELHSVEELVGMVLNSTRYTAEKFADHPMKDSILTVPPYFNQAERKALLDACNMTGLNVLQLMNDNTAVALNYGIFRASTFNDTVKHVMFFDMGANHVTVTVVGYSTTKVKDRGYLETVPQLVVKGVGFDTSLGGLEMDMRLRDHLVKAFKAQHKLKKDVTENPRAMMKLLKEAKRVRQVLSANNDHKAQIESLFEEKDFKTKITRAELEEMCHDLLEGIRRPIKMALDASSIPLEEIDSVVLMGGGSRIPKVQEILREATKKEELAKNINTDEAAALGSVYKAADLTAGFKVKRFLIKDLNVYPVDVQFERTVSGDEPTRTITRQLYHRLNPLPQKKVMTFNKKPADFNFTVTYGDLTFLSQEQRNTMDLGTMMNVQLNGVDEAHSRNTKATSKGVKAYFLIDESGILKVEKVEAHFEKTPELLAEEEGESTLSKLGSKLSSFFGSGKPEEGQVEEGKEEETKKDEEKKEGEEGKEKKEEKKEEKTTEEKAEKDAKEQEKTPKATNTTSNATSSNSTEEVKPKKPVVVKEPITVASQRIDVTDIPADVLRTSVKKLEEYQARDVAKLEREEAMNTLESYLYSFREHLSSDEVHQLSTEDERQTMQKVFDEVGEWLDEDGWEATTELFKSKLEELKKASEDLTFRIDESVERPNVIASMLQSLNVTNMMQKSIKEMPDAKEIYTEKDLKDFENIAIETQQWFMDQWKKQNESDPTKKPTMLSKEVALKQAKLDRELMYLLNKAKYYVPKPKPTPPPAASNTTKTKEKTTKSNETKAEKEEKTEEKKEEDKKQDEEKAKDIKESVKEETKESVKEETKESVKEQTKENTEEKEEVTPLEEPVLELGDGPAENKQSIHNPDDEL